jgi:hypothetical protein
MKPGWKLTPDITGAQLTDWLACPCGGELKVYAKTIIHTLPYCDRFLNDEPADYLHWVRVTYAAN